MRYVAAIAGFDSSGGAGISVDGKTIDDLDCHPYLIQTAMTEQSETAVQSINPIAIATLAESLRQLSKQSIVAIKTGMVFNAEIINVVCSYLDSVDVPIIIDPVLAASSGGHLLEPNALPLFRNTLLKKATLLTPNIPEAEILLGRTIQSNQDIEQAAQAFIGIGIQAVLIKGGHSFADTQCADYWLSKEGAGQWFTSRRLAVRMRGTGCRLSTAIACYLAHGDHLELAIKKAKEFVYNLLVKAIK
jgi:hydroxymethylpyrimidine/phosphomethylpyrimidine kinase